MITKKSKLQLKKYTFKNKVGLKYNIYVGFGVNNSIAVLFTYVAT